MPWVVIPVTSDPDNTMAVINVDINGERMQFLFRFRFNVSMEYWFMDVSNAVDGTPYLSGIPLVTGEYPAADLLEQFHYKGIGRAVIVKMMDTPTTDIPKEKNLGVEFTLSWGDDNEPVAPEIPGPSDF